MNPIKSTILLIMAISFLPLNSCQEEDEKQSETENSVVPEKTEVKTYEIVTLTVDGYYLTGNFNGTFGEKTVDLIRTSDTTLTFYVPDVPDGTYNLTFSMATLKFQVTQTEAGDPSQVVEALFGKFDAEAAAIIPQTGEEEAGIESLYQYKQEVMALFNSLTQEQKREAALFYEANNKATFRSIAENVHSTLDASPVFGRTAAQSACPKTNFNAFYSCTAQNLGSAAVGLKNASKEFLKMLTLAGISAYLAPASFGLSAAGTVLALGTAGYLLIMDVKPAFLKFRTSLKAFITINWIFGKYLFLTVAEEFKNNEYKDLQLQPSYHSITEEDTEISQQTGAFITSIQNLRGYWSKLTGLFGEIPVFQNTQEPVQLNAGDVSISGISNANVQLVEQSSGHAKFKTTSGNRETFSYHIRVSKQGFVREKDLTATVLPPDSTEIYRLSAMGKYLVTPTSDGSTLYCELEDNGSAKYTVYNHPSWADGYIFRAKWKITFHEGKYYYDEDFYNTSTTSTPSGGAGIYVNFHLKYPVTTFNYADNLLFTKQ